MEEEEDEGTGDMDDDGDGGDGDGDVDAAVGENEQDANIDGGPSSAAGAAEPEIDDFEYAWEVLDIARVIYTRTDTDEARLRLADVYLCLGDISMETGIIIRFPHVILFKLNWPYFYGFIQLFPSLHREIRSSHP